MHAADVPLGPHPRAPRCSRQTVGAWRRASRTSGRPRLAPGHRWKDRDLVAVLDGGLEPVEEADVLAPHVNVHEAPQVAVLGNSVAKALEALVQAVEHLAHGACAVDHGLGLTARHAPELR